MGEKGNVEGVAVAAVAAGSLIERITTTATETVVGVGEDLIGTIRDKSIGALADNTLAAARDKMRRDVAENKPPELPADPHDPT